MRVRVRPDFRSRIADGRLHRGLTPLKDYFVLEVATDEVRVIDDKGEPICSSGDRDAEATAKVVVREILEAAMAAGTEDDKRTIQRDLKTIA
jgi:hypothetical protein